MQNDTEMNDKGEAHNKKVIPLMKLCPNWATRMNNVDTSMMTRQPQLGLFS
jgi:hypothetical protein